MGHLMLRTRLWLRANEWDWERDRDCERDSDWERDRDWERDPDWERAWARMQISIVMVKVGLLHMEACPLLNLSDGSITCLQIVWEADGVTWKELLQRGSNRKQVMADYCGIGYAAGSAMSHCFFVYGIHVVR